MREVSLVGYDKDRNVFTLLRIGKQEKWFASVVDVVAAVRNTGDKPVLRAETDWAMKLMFCQVATDAGMQVYDEKGFELNSLADGPHPIRYITRVELGNILPEGWFIEHQLNRYAACHGDELTLPHRRTIERAVLDIHAFLASVAHQATHELVTSIATQLERQESMFE